MSKRNQSIIEVVRRGYIVTSEGTVVSPRGTKLKLSESKSGGYKEFSIRKAGQKRTVSVHRLIAFLKYGRKSLRKGIQVRHLNGNPADNRLDNIAIGTATQNSLDKPAIVRKRAARIGCLAAVKVTRKLTPEEAESLRADRSNGSSYKELMSKYGLAKSTVSYIVNRKTYAVVA
jgi:hypothetical protein